VPHILTHSHTHTHSLTHSHTLSCEQKGAIECDACVPGTVDHDSDPATECKVCFYVCVFVYVCLFVFVFVCVCLGE